MYGSIAGVADYPLVPCFRDLEFRGLEMDALADAIALGGDARLGEDVIDLQADLGETVFRALVAFSRSANRTTGSSHPMDRERWFAFLVAAHRSHVDLSVDVLAKWLALDG